MRNFTVHFNKFKMLTLSPLFCPVTDTWTSSDDLSINALTAGPNISIVSLLYIYVALSSRSVTLMYV